MPITVIVELHAKPGERAELVRRMEHLVAQAGPTLAGFLGSERYEVIDNPDALVEIARWESPESRLAHLEDAATSGSYAPVFELLATPARATILRALS